MGRDPARICGPCTACCTALGVPELGKGEGERCRHLTGGGCGIYEERPGSCQSFECQWLRGLLEVDERVDAGLRPDACGVVFDFRPDPGGDVYLAWEVEAGAAAREPARGIIEGLGERFEVAVIAFGSRG